MATTTMQRWEIDDYGRANLRLNTVPIPEPGPGEVQVKAAAVSLNHRDMMMIADGMGSPLAFPFSPGSGMAGTVAAVGDGATCFRVGDRVVSAFMPDWIDGRTSRDARTSSYCALGGEQLPQEGGSSSFIGSPHSAAHGSACTTGPRAGGCFRVAGYIVPVQSGKLRMS